MNDRNAPADPPRAAAKLTRERVGLLAVLALAIAGCGLGLVEPAAAPHDTREQVLDLVRVVCTIALSLSLLLGPGIAWRALDVAGRPLSLGFLPLPGLLLMIGGGTLAWALGHYIDRVSCVSCCSSRSWACCLRSCSEQAQGTSSTGRSAASCSSSAASWGLRSAGPFGH